MVNAIATKFNKAQANTTLIAELRVNCCRLFHTQEHCQRRREWVGAVIVNETDEWSIFVVTKYVEA